MLLAIDYLGEGWVYEEIQRRWNLLNGVLGEEQCIGVDRALSKSFVHVDSNGKLMNGIMQGCTHV